jgi:hypothetical protein
LPPLATITQRKNSKTKFENKSIQLANGVVFTGVVSKGNASGFGTLIWPDLTQYDGMVKRGLPHGEGIKVWKITSQKPN